MGTLGIYLSAAALAMCNACNRSKPALKPAIDAAVPVTVPSQPPSAPQQNAIRVHEPAVAGSFYPADPDTLRRQVGDLLEVVNGRNLKGLRALVSPHAGYRYSGPIAASGYKQITSLGFERVVIFAPSHRVAFSGVALPDADAMRTPLGAIPISAEGKALAGHAPFVIDSAPHAKEHSLEVQLPFLQVMLERFELVPLVFGEVAPSDVASGVSPLVNDRTLVVASSDLSHYYPYEQAKVLDQGTVNAILSMDPAAIERREACGKVPILALVHLARVRHWRPILIDYRNSGDTSGDRSRVVGYAAIAFVDTPARP